MPSCCIKRDMLIAATRAAAAASARPTKPVATPNIKTRPYISK